MQALSTLRVWVTRNLYSIPWAVFDRLFSIWRRLKFIQSLSKKLLKSSDWVPYSISCLHSFKCLEGHYVFNDIYHWNLYATVETSRNSAKMKKDDNIMKDLHAICHRLSYITITLSLADWKLDRTHNPSYVFIQVRNKFY